VRPEKPRFLPERITHVSGACSPEASTVPLRKRSSPGGCRWAVQISDTASLSWLDFRFATTRHLYHHQLDATGLTTMSNESRNQASFAWVEYDPRTSKKRRALGVYDQQRRVVQAHVAHTSWVDRKATTARKESRTGALKPQRAMEVSRKSTSTSEAQAQADKTAYNSGSRLFSRLLSRNAHAVASMVQKSDRILL
jgi:hypothetical protein